MLLGQHDPSFDTVWELRISANASPYGCLGCLINSTLTILSARGLAHSKHQRNVKNVTFRHTELHDTKKSNLFHYAQNHIHQTSKKIVFLPCCEPVLFCPFGAQNGVQFAWAKYVFLVNQHALFVLFGCQYATLSVCSLCVTVLCVCSLCPSTLYVSSLCVSALSLCHLGVSALSVCLICVRALYVCHFYVNALSVCSLCVGTLYVCHLGASALCVCHLCVRALSP